MRGEPGVELLSPRQQQLIARVQLIGVLVLLMLTVGLPLLWTYKVMNAWQIAAVGFGVGTLDVLVAAVAVARIEHTSTREVLRRGRVTRSVVREQIARARTSVRWRPWRR